jgi:hypothetical protein
MSLEHVFEACYVKVEIPTSHISPVRDPRKTDPPPVKRVHLLMRPRHGVPIRLFDDNEEDKENVN